MHWIHWLYLLSGAAAVGLPALMAYTSHRERRRRAARLSVALTGAVLAAWAAGFVWSRGHAPLLLVIASLPPICALVFLYPSGKSTPLQAGPVTSRVDERDVIFSREEYTPGSGRYDEYYGRRPELQAIDDRIRALPQLLKPGGRFYDPHQSRHIESLFAVIESLTTEVAGSPESPRRPADAAQMTSLVKALAHRLGADDVGVAAVDPMAVYSHVGRGPEPWGRAITNDHPRAVVFTLEMDFHKVAAAPRLPITEETATQYLRGAQISIALAHFIRTLGYEARAHIAGSNYQVMLPPLAHAAGLGELGRIGYIITPRHGARVRLGAVTTNLPLQTDQPRPFGVQDFCAVCRKCAENCPPAAIPRDAKRSVRGVMKWPLNVERCFSYWRRLGTDCGLCMKVCPYSHPATPMHNLVRAAIRRSAPARWTAVRGDDFLYGRRPRPS
ncbi:MAG: 4Fe-4S dicluster domain-containing protein [Candidatus Eisenbacteria bacterium]|nr:4Fe-4S dicluster domain-containing protein [Candidatus Eisenbacteria bacterium]